MISSINIWGVLISAVVAFILGFLAHGPVAGKLWMKLANIVPT
jgi:ABC-type phosphate/phosphonate transport system permease subunit